MTSDVPNLLVTAVVGLVPSLLIAVGGYRQFKAYTEEQIHAQKADTDRRLAEQKQDAKNAADAICATTEKQIGELRQEIRELRTQREHAITRPELAAEFRAVSTELASFSRTIATLTATVNAMAVRSGSER